MLYSCFFQEVSLSDLRQLSDLSNRGIFSPTSRLCKYKNVLGFRTACVGTEQPYY